MAGRVEQFSAKDAFIYTDTYRKAVKLNAATIATEKERLKERFRRGGGIDSAYYAELRGLEHAMNHVVKGEEPKQVILGELDGTSKGVGEDRETRLTAQLADSQRVIAREREDKEKLKRDLKTVGDAYQKLAAEAKELRTLTARLQRKVVQTSSTFGVVGFALFLVIAVLLLALNRPF